MAQVIGTGPNQVPSNSNLGDLAYRNKAQIAGEFATAAQGTTADTALQPADLGATDLPDISPTLNLDFANAQSITSKTTYTRASTATYYDASGTLQTAAVDAPRFDHDPATGERLGILLEEQRTNLLTYSEQFDNAAWAKVRSTITANAATAPDGTTTADKIVEDTTASSTHPVYQGSTGFAAGVTATASVFLKAGERTFVSIGSPASATGTGVNLTTGELVDVNVPGWTNAATRSVTDIGGGWYRVYYSFTTVGSDALSDALRIFPNNGTTTSYTGDGTSGLYVWGAQLEVGSFPTSYIKTEASQVTRSADDLSITGTNFTDFYNQSEGTFVLGLDYIGATAATPVLFSAGTSFSDSTYISNPSTNLGLSIIVGGAAQYTGSSLVRPSTPFKTAIALKQDDMAFVIDGGTVSTDTSGTIPTVTNLYLGRASWNAGNYACIHIKSLTYYPRRLTNVQLQALTTE